MLTECGSGFRQKPVITGQTDFWADVVERSPDLVTSRSIPSFPQIHFTPTGENPVSSGV
jgi:hypothetical protein